MTLPDGLTAAREVDAGKGYSVKPVWRVWAKWTRPDGCLRAGSIDVRP